MDLPTALGDHLRNLLGDLGAGENIPTDALAALVADLRTAVSSYLGLRVTLVLDGWPVTLTAFTAVDGMRPATSLRLALSSLGPGFDPESQVVCYAGTPGAFVDLAADLGYLHSWRRGGRQPTGSLDIDLPPVTLVSGFVGLAEYATINRAVGVLIDRGQDPDQARTSLHRDAATSSLALHHYAARLLQR